MDDKELIKLLGQTLDEMSQAAVLGNLTGELMDRALELIDRAKEN